MKRLPSYCFLATLFLLVLIFSTKGAFAATTVNIYPTDDGLNQLYDDDNITNWEQARNFSGEQFRSPNIDSQIISTRADSSAGSYRIYRSSLVFDTSNIPDDATVTSVKFKCFKNGPANNWGQQLVITEHTRNSILNLSKADWQLSHYGQEFARGNTIDGQYTSLDFNSVGKNYINLSGDTVIGGLQDNDYDDIDIGAVLSGASFYSSEMSGTDKDPYLEVTYTVPSEQNRPPVLNPIENKTIQENHNLTFAVSATDPDDDDITYSANNLPPGATFINGVFSWTPGYSDSGVYVVRFVATDDFNPSATSSTDVVITVGDNPTPSEEAANLVTEIVNYSLPTNIENSYLANLKKVEIFIEQGKTDVAITQLDAFVAKVSSDYKKGLITTVVKNKLINDAQHLIAVLTI